MTAFYKIIGSRELRDTLVLLKFLNDEVLLFSAPRGKTENTRRSASVPERKETSGTYCEILVTISGESHIHKPIETITTNR